jgi:hypothetical protein
VHCVTGVGVGAFSSGWLGGVFTSVAAVASLCLCLSLFLSLGWLCLFVCLLVSAACHLVVALDVRRLAPLVLELIVCAPSVGVFG